MFAVLHEQIKPGNTLEHVENLLGKGTPPKDQAKLVRVLQKMAQVRPQGYPEGIQENDPFAGFSFNGSHSSIVYLQFRNGKLINFDPKEFSKAPDPRLANQ